jgi:hypothetical protein
MSVKSFITLGPGPNIIKLFTTVIYRHSKVIPSFFVIKQQYLGNYCGMAVNYHGIFVTNVIKHNLTYNNSNILHHFNPRKSRVKITAVIYHSIFVTLVPGQTINVHNHQLSQW